jgi:tetratricopeptide (TPR) repeat protein
MESKSVDSMQKILFVISLVAILALFYLIFLPSTQYRIGNIFFGQVSRLYNVNFAQYFYVYSAYPPFGRSPEFAHYQLSRTYFIQGDFDSALAEAKRELELYPNNSRTFYILGLTYGYMGRENEAIEAFSSFIEANPNSWAARNDKAWLQFRIGDIDGALQTIEPVAIITSNPWVQNTHGTLLLNAGRKVEAKQAFLNALEAVSKMSVESWGNAYPGNDPRIYSTGLSAMKTSIESNLKLIEEE